MATIEVAMPPMHHKQREVVRAYLSGRHRYFVLRWGRRSGKTKLASMLAFGEAMQGRHVFWAVPEYRFSNAAWRNLKTLTRPFRRSGLVKANEQERSMTFPGDGWIQVVTVKDPDNVRSEGVHLAVVDETAIIRRWNEVWEALRPTLSDYRGRVIFIGTPKGRNHFYELWAAHEDDPDWYLSHMPSWENPYLPAGEVEQARRELPELVFRQEYGAEFVDDAGGVFRRVREAATAEPQDRPRPGHEYVFGVDWGRHNDYTVIAVIDLQERALVALDRFSKVEYAHQVGRLRALYERFRPRVIVAEANAMGGPLVESLQREGLPVQAFTTTAATKQAIVDALVLAFERGEIRVIPDEVLIAELQAYTATRLPSGHIRYGAPSGMHDDTVMALALAWHAVARDDSRLLLFSV